MINVHYHNSGQQGEDHMKVKPNPSKRFRPVVSFCWMGWPRFSKYRICGRTKMLIPWTFSTEKGTWPLGTTPAAVYISIRNTATQITHCVHIGIVSLCSPGKNVKITRKLSQCYQVCLSHS